MKIGRIIRVFFISLISVVSLTFRTYAQSCTITLNSPHQILFYQDGQLVRPRFDSTSGKWKVELTVTENPFLVYQEGKWNLYNSLGCEPLESKSVPLWVTIIPPVVAIIMAILLRQVVLSLFLAVFLGLFISYAFDFNYIDDAFLQFWSVYIIDALYDRGHLSVIVFSLLISGMVTLLSTTGLMHSLMQLISNVIRGVRSAQLATWFSGILIFFDDYANTLVIGNTMRAITDAYRISREKLAYIVDSTSAPVAATAFITTWIGAELGYIQQALMELGLDMAPYQVFLASLKYAFYPFLTLFFIFMISYTDRDFGPMLHAERRARRGRVAPEGTEDEETKNDHDHPPYWGLFSLIPIIALIAVSLIGLFVTGYTEPRQGEKFIFWLARVIGNGDAYTALLWGSGTGLTVAAILVFALRLQSLTDIVGTVVKGFESLLHAIVILVLAWTLAVVMDRIYTSHYFSHLVDRYISVQLIVPLVFLISALTSLATGTSWGTMALIYPLILPLSWKLSIQAGFPEEVAFEILAATTAAVLGGSVFGDHCSPLSDTTILSSLASGCPIIDHVKTQLPYAITVATVSLSLYLLWSLIGISPYVLLVTGLLMIVVIVYTLGIPVSNTPKNN